MEVSLSRIEEAPLASPSSGLDRPGAAEDFVPDDGARGTLANLPFLVLALVFLAAFAVCALPVLSVGTLPLFDYPNHLARMHILADAGRSPDLQRYYQILWQPLPNLAMDLTVPFLAWLMPLAIAGKIFLLAIFFLTAAGAVALHRSLYHRWSLWPCLAFLLLYNRLLLWGFVNYLFGVGLALIGSALWVAIRPAALRLVVAAIFALLTYFSHLSAFGAFAIFALSFEASRLWRDGRLLSPRGLAEFILAGLAFLPPLVILRLNATGAAGPGDIAFSPFLRKFDLFFNVFDNYSRVFDVACFLLLFGLFVFAAFRRKIIIHPAMAPPLLVLLAVQFAMPNHLFGGFGADHRLPLVLALMLVASSEGFAAGRAKLVAAILGLVFLARIGIIFAVWQGDDQIYRPIVAALRALPLGSRVAIAFPPESVNIPRRGLPMTHLGSLAVIERDAFVPTLFTYAGQQPLRFRPPYDALAAAAAPETLWRELLTADSPHPAAVEALRAYDHLLLLAPEPFPVPAIEGAGPVAIFPTAKLFKIEGEAKPNPIGQ